MDFTADDYYRAALERMSQAHHLYRQGTGHYALAMYAAGLVVESILRASMLRSGKKQFESRHNLLLLANESGMLYLDRDKLKDKGLTDDDIDGHEKSLWAAVNDVFILWRNNYRFASEARLLAHLKKMRLYERVKGDPLKTNALRLLNAAQRFIEKGILPMAVGLRKLKRILEQRFPPPDKVDLRDDDGIIGVVTSRRFRRMDSMQRQDLIHDILANSLNPEERRQVLLIVGVTPEEKIANTGDEDV
jgi:hypothetical protein